MKCSVCGERVDREYTKKGKRCRVCNECIRKLPEFIIKEIKHFTAEEIKDFVDMFYFSGTEIPPVITKLGRLYVCGNEILIRSGFIEYPSYVKISVIDIEDLDLEFIPTSYSKVKGTVTGNINIIITLKHSHYKFRHIIDSYTTYYFMENGVFDIPKDDNIQNVVNILKGGLKVNSFSSYEKIISDIKFERWKRSVEERERERIRQSEEENRQEEERKRREEERRRQQVNAKLEEALIYFSLQWPVDQATLKKRYRELMLKCHPDQNHIDHKYKPEEVNSYYTYLKQYIG